jgi:hypothetical protein
MKVIHKVGLSSAEIAWLWTTYQTDSASICIVKHFLQTNDKEDVKPLLEKSITVSETHLSAIRRIFTEENFPIPQGFTAQDVDLSAPALFFDLYSVSYIYGMSRIGMANYSRMVSNVAREDIRAFFSQCLRTTLDLYNESTRLMLDKGIYDRPPMIPYPDHVEFIRNKETILSKWLEKQRPLNVIEISEMFYNLERNYFGLILLTACIQAAKDEKVRQYFKRGKRLAQKQIQFLNETLISDDLLGNIMVNSEVSTSTVSPFSDKLMMFIITALNTQGAGFVGISMASSSRVDLIAEYDKFVHEILLFGKEGFDIMVEHGWLEEPPHAPDREALAQK